jgi:hypothetical protein
MNKQEIIEAAKKFALANYEEGMDFFVECYTDEEWEEFFKDVRTWGEAEELMRDVADVREEQYRAAMNEVF